MSTHVDDLVNGFNEAESGVEAATTDSTCSVNHSQEGESNGGSLKNTIFALLCTVVDLANDALAEEEGAPELKQEDFSKSIELDTTLLLIIRTEEGWLSETEVGIDNTEEATNDLRNDNHANQRELAL